MADDRSAGRALSRAYFRDLVEPMLATRLPGLRYSAGRLGTGSDVLGLDDETSQDHDWGLRLTLVLPEHSVPDVRRTLDSGLPDSFRGRPTRFIPSGGDVARLHIDVTSMRDLLLPRLGFDPRSRITTEDWLSLTGQSVLEIAAGPVFHDPDGELHRVRAELAWYPDDLWRYVLASGWTRIAQELPLMSRAADVGDATGSRLIAARIAHETMHLAFLLERRWAPYAKWFGTVFGTLGCAPGLGPSVDQLLDAHDRHDREGAVAAALQLLLDIQNGLGLTDVGRATVLFWDRPHLHPDPAIAVQLMTAVSDPRIRALKPGLGSIEQRTDNVDVLVDPGLRRRMVRT